MQNPAYGCAISLYTISKTKHLIAFWVFLKFFLHEATAYSELKGTVISRPAFLFKQSSSEVTGQIQ